LFTTEDESSSGALILLANGSASSNISGCMAIVDGDTSENGCAVRYQAYEECLRAACLGCQSFESFRSCETAAGREACFPFWQAAGCSAKPIYNVCRSYSTFDEYFFAMAQVFCVSGPDAGTTDAGAIGPDGAEAGVPDPDAQADSSRPDIGDSGPP
jgi:hypothetical protein